MLRQSDNQSIWWFYTQHTAGDINCDINGRGLASSYVDASQTWRSWCAKCIRLSTSGFSSIRLYLKKTATSFTQLGGTNDVNYKYYMDIWQSITKIQHRIRRSLPIRKYVILYRLSPLKQCCLLPKLRQAELALLRLQHHLWRVSQTIPMSSVETLLDNTSMRIAVSLRLGAPLCTPHNCVCGMAVDSSGAHGLSCRKSRCQTHGYQ